MDNKVEGDVRAGDWEGEEVGPTNEAVRGVPYISEDGVDSVNRGATGVAISLVRVLIIDKDCECDEPREERT